METGPAEAGPARPAIEEARTSATETEAAANAAVRHDMNRVLTPDP